MKYDCNVCLGSWPELKGDTASLCFHNGEVLSTNQDMHFFVIRGKVLTSHQLPYNELQLVLTGGQLLPLAQRGLS